MADIVGRSSFDTEVGRRLKEVRSGEYAPEVWIDPVDPGTAELAASSGNVANASAAATLGAASGKTTSISGFSVTGAGATGASVVVVTVVGLTGGTHSYIVAVPAGVTTGVAPLVVSFDRPIPASAANTAIVVTAPAFGAGNTNATVNAWGLRR